MAQVQITTENTVFVNGKTEVKPSAEQLETFNNLYLQASEEFVQDIESVEKPKLYDCHIDDDYRSDSSLSFNLVAKSGEERYLTLADLKSPKKWREKLGWSFAAIVRTIKVDGMWIGHTDINTKEFRSQGHVQRLDAKRKELLGKLPEDLDDRKKSAREKMAQAKIKRVAREYMRVHKIKNTTQGIEAVMLALQELADEDK